MKEKIKEENGQDAPVQKKESKKEEGRKERRSDKGFTNGFTLMFIPTRGDIKQFFISQTTARIILGVLVVLVISAVAAVATYSRLVMTASRVFMLQEENRKLREEVSTIDSIKSELVYLQQFREQVLRMMGADSATIERLRKMTYNELVQLYPEMGSPIAMAEGGGEPDTAQAEVNAPDINDMPASRPSLPRSTGLSTEIPNGLPVMTKIYRISLGFKGPHTGIDIATRYNTPVIATADGIVEDVSEDSVYGKHVLVKHKNGYETLYAHMSSVRVSKGERVRKGQVLGFVGMTGHTTGPHVHYEVRLKGVPVNPAPYLKVGG